MMLCTGKLEILPHDWSGLFNRILVFMSLQLKLLPDSVRLTAKYWDIKFCYYCVACSVYFHPFTQLHTNGHVKFAMCGYSCWFY
jgi:hypothetical protein